MFVFKKNKFYRNLIFFLFITLIILLITLAIKYSNYSYVSTNHSSNGLLSDSDVGDSGNDDDKGFFSKLASFIVDGITNGLNAVMGIWIWQLIIKPILCILSAFSTVILAISGGSLIKKTASSGDSTYLSLSIPTPMIVLMIVTLFIFAILSTINIIMATISAKNGDGALKGMVLNTFFGVVLLCLLPLLFILSTEIINSVLDYIGQGTSVFGGGSSMKWTASDSIFKLGLNDPSKFDLSKLIKNGTDRYDEVHDSSSYNCIYPLIACVAYLFGYFQMTITLIHQLFELLCLYFLSSLAIVNFSKDGGERFKMVFGQFRGKLISNFMIIVGIQLFGYLTPIVQSAISGVSSDAILTIFLNLSVLIAGLMFMMGFNAFVGQFTGDVLKSENGRSGMGMLTGGLKKVTNPVGTSVKGLTSKATVARKNSAGYQAKQDLKGAKKQFDISKKRDAYMASKKGKKLFKGYEMDY